MLRGVRRLAQQIAQLAGNRRVSGGLEHDRQQVLIGWQAVTLIADAARQIRGLNYQLAAKVLAIGLDQERKAVAAFVRRLKEEAS